MVSKLGLVAVIVCVVICVAIASLLLTQGSAGTQTVAETSKEWKPPKKIKAAWIYVGPVGDYGWSYMHDLGRRIVQKLFRDWLETTYVERVSKATVKEVIDKLVRQGYTVIFTTSFDFMDPTYEKALEYPDVMFFHCSGYKRLPNMGTYFADLYQVYYLNGLIAGALTKTGKIGYVAAHLIPEVVRHINAFAIGAKEVGEQLGKNITVYVIEIGEWYAPEKAREAAKKLIEMGCDVIAYTEDSPAIIQLAEELYKTQGKLVYVFSHYSPMYQYGPDVVVSGQLVRWEVIYADILTKIKAGILRPGNLQNVDYWYLLNTGAVDLGCYVYPNGSVMHINPKFVPILKKIYVTDKLTGRKVSVYDLVMERYELMKNAPLLQALQQFASTHRYENVTHVDVEVGTGNRVKYPVAPVFDPFTGPLEGYKIKTGEKVVIPSGVRLGHDDLWNMDWFVSWVKLLGSA